MKKQTVGIFLLVALLWTAFAAATYVWLIPIQQGSDFRPPWYGAREILRGTNPYLLPQLRDLFLSRDEHVYPAALLAASI